MLRTRLSDALKTAMKAKEGCAVSTLRLIHAALKDRDIAARGNGNMDGIGDDDILSLFQSMIKQRRESIDAYQRGGRMELAQSCFDFLPTRAELDLAGWPDSDIFAHS